MNETNFGLVITSYNRPKYLKQTLAELDKTIWPTFNNGNILIIDDCSTDISVKNIILDWKPNIPKHWRIDKIFLTENKAIYGVLPIALEKLIKQGCNLLCNIDNDICCKPHWLNKLFDLHNKFPNHIITGFNPNSDISFNVNNDENTKQLGYVEKMATSGINLLYSIESYYKYIKPSFAEKLRWDWKVLDIYFTGDKKLCITSYPSCIQHIGIESSIYPGEKACIAKDY